MGFPEESNMKAPGNIMFFGAFLIYHSYEIANKEETL
jgi:hypothetical protein